MKLSYLLCKAAHVAAEITPAVKPRGFLPEPCHSFLVLCYFKSRYECIAASMDVTLKTRRRGISRQTIRKSYHLPCFLNLLDYTTTLPQPA